ncbi:hypothetical protein [Spirosoma radiotolerans]|uniref:Uncharacterized protein n=1 Tax=Spirosoma radiotolerans TaxID=1379870 RepID=A0A0E3ZX92_9BACT|nr:hypothetical protein [Spirosoma radiotolerans]AKD56810.1 hypothetical protein SD10_19795 [Spirosoma radiotolerans]
MNPNETIKYDPADDENQGIMTKMIQGENAGGGVAQTEYLSPVVNQGPEPEKEEVNDSDTEANGVNDDMLAEEDVEEGDIDESDDE